MESRKAKVFGKQKPQRQGYPAYEGVFSKGSLFYSAKNEEFDYERYDDYDSEELKADRNQPT